MTGERPQIRLQITVEYGSIVSTRLSLDTVFRCEITGATPNETQQIHEWLRLYDEGRSAPLPLSLKGTTPFQEKVLLRLQKIPSGRTESYSSIARSIGNPKAARAIGGACNKNPIPFFIPCHRVVAADGSLGGFAIDLEIKRRLLEFESRQNACSQ